jgi:hypothetical protein
VNNAREDPLARPGGRIANIGEHGEPATLHDTYSTPALMRLVASRQIDARK